MSEITEIVDNLENRISKLLHRYDVMKQANESLQEELTSVKAEYEKLEVNLQTSQEQVQTLKLQMQCLAVTDNKRETKLKINA